MSLNYIKISNSTIPFCLMDVHCMTFHTMLIHEPLRTPRTFQSKIAGVSTTMQFQLWRFFECRRTEFAQIFAFIRVFALMACQQMLIDKLCIADVAFKHRIIPMPLHVLSELFFDNFLLAQFARDLFLFLFNRN